MSGNSGRILVCRGLRVSGRCVYRDKDGMCFTDGQTMVPCTATAYVPLEEHSQVERERDEARKESQVYRLAVCLAAELLTGGDGDAVRPETRRLIEEAAGILGVDVAELGREKG